MMTLHFLPESGNRPRVGAQQLPRLLFLVVLLLSPAIATAQASQAEPPKPREPETVALKANDGVKLTATYYPSKAGKNAAAVILLHAHAGKRSDLDGLARRLQLADCAVIAPDLRGHGDSAGDFGELKPQDYADMYERDLEAVKGFLMQQNNAGELNVERLGVVGLEMGSMVAINWAALDWSWPKLASGKQGEDVKALVLISPEWSYKGVRISDAVVDPSVRSELAILIVSGSRNSRLIGEARRLYKALAKYHDVSPSLPVEQQTLVLKTPTTSMQGMPLLNDNSMHVEDMILEFVALQLQKPALAWQMRKSPL